MFKSGEDLSTRPPVITQEVISTGGNGSIEIKRVGIEYSIVHYHSVPPPSRFPLSSIPIVFGLMRNLLNSSRVFL